MVPKWGGGVGESRYEGWESMGMIYSIPRSILKHKLFFGKRVE